MEPATANKPVPAPSVSAMNYASFWERLAASFVDGLIIGVGSLVIQIPFIIVGTIMSSTVGPASADVSTLALGALSISFLGQILAWILSAAYYVYFIGAKGQTPGKQLLKIKVVKLDTGQVPGYSGAALRELIGKFVSAIIFFIGYFWMLWDEKKQTLHDKIAGTVVVKA